MIDFRYHVVSLVSVFLALAVGIVLGAGPLKGPLSEKLNSEVEQLRKDKADLHTELETAQNAADNRDAFTAAVVPSLVGQQLIGTSVVLVTVPGVNSDAVKPLTQALQAAGATVTGQIEIKDAWTDPGRAKDRDSALKTLTASQSASVPGSGASSETSGAVSSATGNVPVTQPVTQPVPTQPGTPTPTASVPGASATGVELTGLLARAVVTDEVGLPGQLDPTARALLDGLRKADLIGVGGNLAGGATEAVVLVPGVVPGGGKESSPTVSGTDPTADWAALTLGLDARSIGTVVVGPASSATQGGVVAVVRSQKSAVKVVSTVDTGGTPMGNVTTVLALREQSLGGSGSYGFVGRVDGPLPIRPGTAKP